VGKETGVDWCDHTFNAWWGCFKISPGCKNCYAATFDKRLGGDHWQPEGPRKFFGEKYWRQPLAWNRAAQTAGVRRRVFCSSMADILEQHPDPDVHTRMRAARMKVTDLVRETPWLDWMFLTKRIENAFLLPWVMTNHHMPNAWLGVTAEDNEHAQKRIPMLQAMRPYFAKLFVSYEPALGPINWSSDLLRDVDMVIFGDESGHHRRDAEVGWALATRNACAENGVTFYFKQWAGADVEGVTGVRTGAGKSARGVIHLPLLDGTQHGEHP
jgi:protein gp37